ncbi:proline--tRNA ligase [Candidatus Marinimicrobia bacterium]|jgi:prolyl-tRNA synthetase|nr:proline--tRNA ligase [Candidatus Neomarinimicrobiota bacterium]|tara:strand:- start:3391 stop:4860 length:1470 start_codon:yes stop_codon:yes gene_type:complete
MSKSVTPQSENYNTWYTDVVMKADLADYGPVKGTMVVKPYGFSMWDLIKDTFDKMIKETGHVNAYFPLFIPKSFLAKEAEHVEGFAKECAVVTHTRLKSDSKKGIVVDPDSKLEEEVIVRPTSETVIWSMYKKWIQSYRDLPLLINQWANVVRWEMRTRLFLRTTEFLWQEGHTAHATAEEAEEETLLILELYRKLAEDYLAMPVHTGFKSESEKFAGADRTYCIEAIMGDKRALQAGTSHNLGQNFAKAFDVTFQTKDNKEQMVYATSWGISTRLVGGVIMTHGDDKGLRLPPKIAPYQVVVVPIFKDKEGQKIFNKYLESVLLELRNAGVRIHEDWRKGSPGFKFNEWEMKGVPIRLEVGPKDIEKHQVVIARRDTGEKQFVKKEDIVSLIPNLLDSIQNNLFEQAKQFRLNNTHTVSTYADFKEVIKNKGGFIRCGWDGTAETETAIKNETKATIRVIPFDENTKGLNCIFSGKPAKHEVIFAKAY